MNRVIARLTLAMLAGAAMVTSGPASASSYSVAYNFSNTDGAAPVAGLLNVPGASGTLLYGTTSLGGLFGDGTVYTIDPATNAETVVYSFDLYDGYQPVAALINVGGTLYGTTGYGGTGAYCPRGGCGTVFAIDPTGSLTVVYSFSTPSNGDGSLPTASLIKVGGKLYGTTEKGGVTTNNGTVYSIDLSSSAETVEYSFQGGSSDGSDVLAGLTKVGTVLYGTTAQGGPANNGTVFKFVPATSTESVVYAFGSSSSDGAHPWAGLINVGGILYGATTYGGGTGCGGGGCGTVFSVDPSTGTESIVHTFTGPDGQYPVASLVNVAGILYGATEQGGASTYGTIYKIDPTTNVETVLHSFGSGSDGRSPRTTLISVGGTLYGTTQAGGSAGYGTVFAYTP